MYAFTTLVAGTFVAVAAYAAPAPPTITATDEPVARTTPFGIVLKGQDPYNGLVLRAEPSDTNPNGKNLVFERPSAFSPSPAYLNGTVQQLNSSAGDFAYLNFVNDDKDKKDDFGVYLPDVGDGPGFTDSVSASLGIGNAAFNIAANRVYGQLHAAPNTFLGCNATIGSTKTPAFILEWGNFNANGSFAPGCIPVQLGTVTLPSN